VVAVSSERVGGGHERRQLHGDAQEAVAGRGLHHRQLCGAACAWLLL